MATLSSRVTNDRTRPLRSFRDLNVWKKALDLALKVHRVTAAVPSAVPEELSRGMREAAIAVTTQLAQGHTHSYTGDFLRCLDLSLCALADLETRVILAGRLGHLEGASEVEEHIAEVRRMEWGLVNSLRARNCDS